jgi:hypothetical protein
VLRSPRASALGTPRRPVVPVSGGHSNQLWRLETDQGRWAVKQMNRSVGDWWLDALTTAMRVEAAALARLHQLALPAHATLSQTYALPIYDEWVSWTDQAAALGLPWSGGLRALLPVLAMPARSSSMPSPARRPGRATPLLSHRDVRPATSCSRPQGRCWSTGTPLVPRCHDGRSSTSPSTSRCRNTPANRTMPWSTGS